MKKSLIAVALSLSIPAAIAAGMGPYGDPGPPRGPNIERLAQVLGLSDEQEIDLQVIFEERDVKRQTLQEETRAQIQQVLSAEQLARWDAFRAGRRHHHHGGWRPCAQP